MPTSPQNPNPEFVNQLERLYRGGADNASNRSQPTPQENPLFRGTVADQAVPKLDRLFQDEDLSRKAATERNNAIQNNAARQTQAQLDADLLRKQEQAALERIRQNRLSRPPNELLERQFPNRPGLVNVERFRDQRPSGQPPGGSSGSGGRSGGGSGGGGRPSGGGLRPSGGGGLAEGGGGAAPVAEPPAGIPTGGLPRSPGLPSINLKLPFQIPPGVATPLSRIAPFVGKGVGVVGSGLAIADAIQNIIRIQEKQRNNIERLLHPAMPELTPGLGNASDRIQPVNPSPFQADEAVDYLVTTSTSFSATDFQGNAAPAGTSIESFTVRGPVVGTIVESQRNAEGVVYSKGFVVLAGNPPVRYAGGGGGNFAGGGIVRILKISDNRQVYSNPDPTHPNANPQRSFPSAPQPRQQPVAPAPTLNPSAPPGSPPTTPSSSGGGTSPNPIAPAFPSQPPGVPSLPGLPGIPLIPLAMPQRTAVPSAVPGASPSPGGSASSGGAAPNANPYYQPKWADPTAAPSPGESGGTPTAPPTNPAALTCRFQFDQQVRSGVTQANTGIGQANTKIGIVEATTTALQTYVTAQVTNINAKLGPLIPGGITGQLLLQWGRIVKIWNFLQIDRLLNVLTWIGVLHNAYMLSNGLAQTLFSAIGNVLDVIGIQKVDAQGNESPYEIGALVGQWTDSFFKRVFGVETVNGIKSQWKKYNRIYQAATNIINSVQSMVYSMLSALETVGQYVSAIGNAAKTFGVFAENCYGWMAPNFNFANGKWFRVLNNVQEAVEVVDNVASEVQNIQQTASDLHGQKAEAEAAIASAVDGKKTAEDRKKQESQGAAVTPAAQVKPNP